MTSTNDFINYVLGVANCFVMLHDILFCVCKLFKRSWMLCKYSFILLPNITTYLLVMFPDYVPKWYSWWWPPCTQCIDWVPHTFQTNAEHPVRILLYWKLMNPLKHDNQNTNTPNNLLFVYTKASLDSWHLSTLCPNPFTQGPRLSMPQDTFNPYTD